LLAASRLAAVLVLLALSGCGRGGAQRAASGETSFAERASFVVAADRICATHLQNILAWLGQPRTGKVWQQQAVTNEGIYRILGQTIQRLEALGPPPAPHAEAFAAYLKTLKDRAVVYRLASRANRQRDMSFASQLQRRLSAIDDVGDRDAHRYGQRVCGAGLPDLDKAFAPPRGAEAAKV
jgi:hypothetical protein